MHQQAVEKHGKKFREIRTVKGEEYPKHSLPHCNDDSNIYQRTCR